MIIEFESRMAEELEKLVEDSFLKFVAPDYSEKGCATFFEFAKTDRFVTRAAEGNKIVVFEADSKIVGMIEARDNNHICLFFVHPDFIGQGIGRSLFINLLDRLKGFSDFIEVNSSTFALPVYEKLGFAVDGELQEVDGIQFIPMKMYL